MSDEDRRERLSEMFGQRVGALVNTTWTELLEITKESLDAAQSIEPARRFDDELNFVVLFFVDMLCDQWLDLSLKQPGD